ncbi:MAG: hypothetical protein Q8P56_05170, partial [Candidatus Uhrbacteria bacterium]|nr:hypothetical protein [Candidatus Uhrbacteria bacterium]
MSKRFLNFFIRYSSFLYSVKKRIVEERDVKKTIFYAVELLGVEALLMVVSLPLFIMVPPERLQERGFIFPQSEKEPDQVKVYIIRRKISLVTILGAGGLFLVKVLFVAIVSSYLLGVQPLLAATQNWDFSVAGDYTYDSAKIEVTGGVAQLKNISASGSSTNGGLDTDATGWTYNDWLEPTSTSANGSFVSSGGNPGGFVRVDLTSTKRNKTVAGFWMQPFTTTVANPASATLTFDWKADTFVSPTAPTTFQVYAFINTATGSPIVTQNVWGSGEITGTTGWSSTSSIDIASKLTAAGTYYLKVAVYATAPNANASYAYSAVIDNISMNWSQSASSLYATDTPTINPTTSLTLPVLSSWDSFTETATKNGGEIYYQLSDDDGATWKYWNGAAWTLAGVSNYSTATVVNTNIGSFPTGNKKIRWKAFLSSSGSQQVILDNIAIGYTENAPPVISNLTGSQNSSSGYIHVDYSLSDTASDPSSLTVYEYSLDGNTWQTMTTASSDPSHDGIAALTSSPGGTAHTFVWNAAADLGAIYSATVQVRLQANDGIISGTTTTSSAFAVDYVVPVVSSVSAVQSVGTTNVQITYDVSDNTSTDLLIELDISDDGGFTWSVVDTSVSGNVGSGQTTGVGKTITWNAGTDFDEQQQADIQVRVRAKDKWQNQGTNVVSSNFSLDTLNPVTNVTANLQSQPNAGDTTALIGGSFTESNPNTNVFYVAINAAAYGSATSGTSDTATPSNQVTAVGATLDGNDYISSVKIVHTDDFGQSVTNENTSPNTAYKYVKPYTPAAPTVDNPLTTRVDVTVNKNASETNGLEYAIFETSQNKYVQSDGTLGASAVWQTLGTTAGQWGNALAVSGKVRVTGLSSPVSLYSFKTKSRNISDAGNAVSSESALSSAAQITNTAPVFSTPTGAQTTDGAKYTSVDYTGTDGQGDINSLTTYQYSRDNATWSTMTEKSGVGSDGITNLTFLPTGSSHTFKWDSGTDLSNIEDSSVFVRLKSNDTQTDSNLATSSSFEIDNKLPVVSTVTAAQNSGAKTVAIQYNLTDANSSLVELSISQDGGATWTVTSTTTTGAVGSGVTSGTGKTITWNAGTDFDNQYQPDMRVRIRARDAFGNQGAYAESSDFALDTKDPSISNVTAAQDTGADTFTFHYDLSEDQPSTTIGLEVSRNAGVTWMVPVSSATGDVGSGVTSGTGKTIAWNGAVDNPDQEKTNMRIRITATDAFTNASTVSSVNFSLDTLAPRVTNVSAVQTLGTTTVAITFDLVDQNNSTVEFDISSNSGSTWTVTDTTASGAVGSGTTPATGKTITWDAGSDFNAQLLTTMRARVRARDVFNNQSASTESADFSLDTTAPTTLGAADLKAQPNAGDTTALIGGSFIETNPNTNSFYVAINGAAYGSATAGQTNTAAPADQATGAGATLDGNDYISKVKIVHTDDYGQSATNEDTSPNTAYVYVKPYTPLAP